MKILAVTAVQGEADAIRKAGVDEVVVSGIGRTNAAATTVRASLALGPFQCVLSVGVAGALPGSDLHIGDLIAACHCWYAEEGIITPQGWQDMTALGFPLGEFEGNAVPCSPMLVRRLADAVPICDIATVATCSGTNEAAEMISDRTGCAAEAMEGAAVVHTATMLGCDAIEIRSISNTTGDRAHQEWDLTAALRSLQEGVPALIDRIREEHSADV
jgi:futalosine hydrolase